jgi:acyl carrier protein
MLSTADSEQYGDDSYPAAGVTLFAGTFVRHPLTLAATAAVLKHLKAAGPSLQERLSERTARLVDDLNAVFERRGVPAGIHHFGSIRCVRRSDLHAIPGTGQRNGSGGANPPTNALPQAGRGSQSPARTRAHAAKRASDFRADRSRNKDDGDLAGCPSSSGNRPTSNFFDLGGHSLMAMRLMIKVASTFGVKIRPESQFHWS